jgi:hypothetical protein
MKFYRILYPSFSNFGNVESLVEASNSNFKVKNMFVSVNIELFGPSLMSHLVTLGNDFYFTFTSVSPAHSLERLTKVSDSMISMLEKFQ